jgi:hypothetical protein
MDVTTPRFMALSIFLYEGAYKIQSNVLDIGIVLRFIINMRAAARVLCYAENTVLGVMQNPINQAAALVMHKSAPNLS